MEEKEFQDTAGKENLVMELKVSFTLKNPYNLLPKQKKMLLLCLLIAITVVFRLC